MVLYPNKLPESERVCSGICMKKVLEKKEIKQTWLANKLDKSFYIVNSDVCNYRQPSLEV